MDNQKFNNLKKQGQKGVEFFLNRHNELLQHPVVPLLNMDDWNVEGSDIAGERLLWRRAVEPNGTGNEKVSVTPYLEFGGIEIKTLGEDQFLPRFGIDYLKCGTIGIPIWGKTDDLPDGRTNYNRNAYGNLRRWMEPSVENRGARPIILAHLLQTKDLNKFTGREEERFFAAIIFENVDTLLQRLTSYLKSNYGIDITDWESVPVGEEARKLRNEIFQGNMLQMPLSEISDLVTVTMIGNDPDIYSTGRCPTDVQRARLEYLKCLAGGRWAPQEKVEADYVMDDEDLLNFWKEKLLFHNVKYHGLLNKDGSPIEP